MIFYIYFVSYCTLIAMLMMMFFYISNFSPAVDLPSNGMKINDASDQVSELWRITSNNATYLIILVPFHKSSYSFKIFSDSARVYIEIFMIEYLYPICFRLWFDMEKYWTQFLHPYYKSCHIFMVNSMIARQASHTLLSQNYVMSRCLYLALCSAWYQQQHDFAISEE